MRSLICRELFCEEDDPEEISEPLTDGILRILDNRSLSSLSIRVGRDADHEYNTYVKFLSAASARLEELTVSADWLLGEGASSVKCR